MSDYDQKLFACHKDGPYSVEEWKGIFAHIITKLETFLEQPVQIQKMDFFLDGFAGDICSPQPFGGLLKYEWFGRIGATVVGNNEATVLEAFLFIRACGKRLVAIDGHAYLYLEYIEQTPDTYVWSPPKWEKDEFGEFEDWK